MSEQLTKATSIDQGQGVVAAIRRADLADSTKTKYLREVEKYLATGARLTDPQALADYAADLSKSSRATSTKDGGRKALRIAGREHITDDVRHYKLDITRGRSAAPTRQ